MQHADYRKFFSFGEPVHFSNSFKFSVERFEMHGQRRMKGNEVRVSDSVLLSCKRTEVSSLTQSQ